MKKYASLDVWCCGAASNTKWTPSSRESSYVLCTGITKDNLIMYSVWHQNKHLIIWNNFQSLVTQHPFTHDIIPMTHLLTKKVHLNLINLNVESLLLLSLIKVKSRKYAWSSDLFGVINGFSLHNMIVVAAPSTRAACYTILLTSNTKRRAFFLVRGHSETHLLGSSVILVTSYSSITTRVSACIFPNFRQWKEDFTAIKFSRECRKFFVNHINCLNSEKTEVKNSFHMHFKEAPYRNLDMSQQP